jgi:hypothetical protein
MKSSANKSEQIANFVVCISAAIPAVIFVVWSRSILSILCLAIAGILIVFYFVRSRKVSEKDAIGRTDELMGKTKDDAAEMARWVP